MRVDTILTNAVIHAGAHPMPVDALAIDGDRIVATGRDCVRLEARRRVDLGRASPSFPGFHDAHNHMAWFGMSLDELHSPLPRSHGSRRSTTSSQLG